jgi:hypothetical protein
MGKRKRSAEEIVSILQGASARSCLTIHSRPSTFFAPIATKFPSVTLTSKGCLHPPGVALSTSRRSH